MITMVGRDRRRRLVGLIGTLAIVVAACGGGTASQAPASQAPASQAPASQAPAASEAPASVAPSAAPELEGTITFLHKYGDPRYTPYFDGVVAGYLAAHPKVKIEVTAETDQGVKDKLTVMAASNSLPDIYFSWAGDYTKKFVRAGMAADLTEVVSGEWKDSFSTAALSAYTYDGKLYGVPITLDAKYLVYNTKLFADNGVTVPTTFEELLAACDAFTAKGIKEPIAFGNQFGWPAIHYMTQLNAYEVPAATLATDYDPATGAFTDPGYEKALQDFADLNTKCLTKGSNGISHENGQANFLNSTKPMHYLEAVEFQVLTEAGGAPKALADNWAFMKLPAPASAPGDKGALEGAPDGFLVNSKSAHLDIAVDFLKYLTNLENAQKLTKTLGWLSPIKGSATADNTFPQNVQVVDDISRASSMAIWLDTVTHSDVAKAYLDGVQGMLDGTKTAADLVKDVQAAAASAKASQ
jgi:raffinose/stachyose/melibiose transport system substrate-binding protein